MNFSSLGKWTIELHGSTIHLVLHLNFPASTGKQRQCQSHHHIKLNKSKGYIATVETEEHGFGSAECPWNIVVNPGQRINITLYNFARHTVTTTGDARPDVCYEIGEIREKSDRKRVTLCDALGRQTSIYVSKTNSVSLQFVSGPTLRSLGAFVFKYDGRHLHNAFYFKMSRYEVRVFVMSLWTCNANEPNGKIDIVVLFILP